MSWRRTGFVLAALLLATAVLVPAGVAGKPTITKDVVDETFADEFLSAACGVPVTTHLSGHAITRTFTEGGRLIEVFTINFGFIARSAEGTFRIRDVGADVIRITKDGVVQQIVGKLPFFYNGTMWVDPITGEVLKPPTGADLFERQLAAACAALAP